MRSNIESLLEDGFEIAYKDVSLVNITTFIPMRENLKRKWHLTSNKFNKLFESKEEAIDTFLKLAGKE